MAAKKKWDGTTYGNGLMHRWLIRLLRRIDIRLIYIFAYVFVVPPTLFRPGFKFIYRFFRECLGQSAIRSFCNSYRNHCVFAEAVIDRFAMYAGREFDIEIEGYEHFQRLANRAEGFVQLSSHVGNYEIAGYSLTAKDKPMNALVFFGEKASVMQNRRRMLEQRNIRMIPIREDMSHLFLLDDALTKGEIVSIPGDRIWGSQKTVGVNFLNREARLPMGPFRVITTRGMEGLIVHVMKVKWLKYKVFVKPIHYDKQAPRHQQIEELARQYAEELERMVDRYPTQWYNYFDFFEH